MTLSEIRDECWDQARDDALVDADRLWPQAEMDRYINRTYRQIARETHCIRDSTTPAVCLISVAPVDYTTYDAGTLDYIWANDSSNWLYQKDVTPYLLTLHSSILYVDEVKWLSQPWRLIKVSSSKWRADNPWWERVIGQPTEYALDLQTGKLALNYRKEDSDTLQLVVRRMPLADLSDDADTPEFRVDYHDAIIDGVMEQMYSKRDAETLDEAKALEFGAKFALRVDRIKKEERDLHARVGPSYPLEAFR